jgi:hypothetical protein
LADVRKIKTLGKLLFKLETRSRSGSSRKIIILIFSYLLPGLFLPYIIFRHGVDPTGYEYTFLTYLFFTVILSFTFISELDNLVISKSETDVFSTLPVEDEIIVKAKMYVIIRYLLVLSLPLFIPAGVFYYFIVRSIPRILLYYLSAMILSQFIINLILLFYCIALMNFRLKRLSTYIYIFQVLLIFFLVVGYQFVSYSFTGRGGISYFEVMLNNGALQYFPQAWYSFIPVSQNVSIDYRMLVKSILPIFLTYFSFLSLKLYLSENYSSIRERFSYSGIFAYDKRSGNSQSYLAGLRNNFIENLYIKNKAEQASYTLLKNFFRRDKAVKLNLLPMIMIPVGLAIFALLTNQLPPPFGIFFLDPPGSSLTFHISIMLAVFMVINTSLLGIRVTSNPAASWIYDSYPIESRKRFKNGIRKFFVLYLLTPVCLVLFIIFSFAMPLLQALVHTLYIFSVSNLFCSIVHSLSKTFPFTRGSTVINSVQRIFSMFLAIIFGIPFVVLQVFVYRSVLDAFAASVIVITATYWINYLLFVRDK